jgi:hypothetical protein
MRKFNRHDAASIRRAVRAYFGTRMMVEAGERDMTGNREFKNQVLTFDSTKWPEDSDLNHTYVVEDISEEIAPGYTLDLYVYEVHPEDSKENGDLLTNLDAKWNGETWEIYDPFSPGRVVTDTPKTGKKKNQENPTM